MQSLFVEAVEHNIEHGLTAREATIKAMEEVTFQLLVSLWFCLRIHSHGVHGRH